MTLYDRVCAIAKEKGLVISRIERECSLSNATIRRWTTQNPSLDSVQRVAHYLNVSIDYLAGNSEQAHSSCNKIPLSQMENDLITMYRLLPEEEREDIFDIVHLKYKRRVERKKESIYWTYFEEDSSEESGPAEGREAQGGTA